MEKIDIFLSSSTEFIYYKFYNILIFVIKKGESTVYLYKPSSYLNCSMDLNLAYFYFLFLKLLEKNNCSF